MPWWACGNQEGGDVGIGVESYDGVRFIAVVQCSAANVNSLAGSRTMKMY